MLLKIWLANIVLAVVVLFVGMNTIEVWTEKRPLKIRSARQPSTWVEKRITKRTMPPESEYQVVVSDNLFFADRSEVQHKEPEKKAPASQKVGGTHLKILEQVVKHTNLYGVIIAGDRREALIGEIPVGMSGRSGEKEVKRAKVGDTVGRFKVKEINNRSVLLTAGGHEWQISLFDKDKPKKRGPLKKATGPIVAGAGSKPIVGVIPEGKKAREKRPVPVISRKVKKVDMGTHTRGPLPVPNRSESGKR